MCIRQQSSPVRLRTVCDGQARPLIQELLYLRIVLVLGSVLYHEPINDRPYTKAATCEQLTDPQANVAYHETVDSEVTAKYRNDKTCLRVLNGCRLQHHHFRIVHAYQSLSELWQLVAVKILAVRHDVHVSACVVS